MTKHILDRPIWSALSAQQTKFSEGDEYARRFRPSIGPLASAKDDSPQALRSLKTLIKSFGNLAILQADPIMFPENVEVIKTLSGVQMVLENLNSVKEPCDRIPERLTEADIPAMVALARLTEPGPFDTETASLGAFWGIKDGETLLAMAGERSRPPGHTEVSGVCVHPSARGKGYARTLSALVASRIQERGEIPFLHSVSSNTAAIRLYETLGFRIRCPIHVAVLGRLIEDDR